MKSLDEINQSLAKTEEELARLNSLRTKLLARITELQQEKALSSDNPSFPQQSVILASVTSQSTQEFLKLLYSAVCFEDDGSSVKRSIGMSRRFAACGYRKSSPCSESSGSEIDLNNGPRSLSAMAERRGCHSPDSKR